MDIRMALHIVGGFVAAFAFLYLMGVYVSANPNPMDWPEGGRILHAWASLFGGLGGWLMESLRRIN